MSTCKECISRRDILNDYAGCIHRDNLKHKIFNPYTGDFTKKATPFVLTVVFLFLVLSMLK